MTPSATGYIPPVLLDLESRAGASDTDRPAWLAERRGGCTATEVRDLYIRAKSTAKLIAVKTGEELERDLGAFLPRIRYGKDREAVIAERIAGEGFVAESRVFHHRENSRYLASPDGIRVTFDEAIEVSEIKTDEHGIFPGETEAEDSAAFRATGYRYQCQWVMYVLEAQRCRLVIEECVQVAPGVYTPGEIRSYWIERDDDLITELREVADEFLAALDDVRENGKDMVAVSLLEDAFAAERASKDARAALEQYLASNPNAPHSLRIPEGSMSYRLPAPKRTFQQSAFKAAHPALAEEFTESVAATKPTLRLTPARTKKVTPDDEGTTEEES